MRSLKNRRSRMARLETLESRRVLNASADWINFLPIAEATTYGSAGDRSFSRTSDDVYQVLKEASDTDKLHHIWAFNLPTAKATRLVIEAHSDAVDEVFRLSYSTDRGKTYKNMLTVDGRTDSDRPQTFALPDGINGEVLVLVRDSNASGREANRLFVDRLLMQVSFQDHPSSILPTPQSPIPIPESPLPQPGAPQLAPGTPLSILPMGDSISSGVSAADARRRGIPAREGYLPNLWNLLESEYVDSTAEFVGTSTYNSSDLPEAASSHALYRGFSSYSFFPHRLEHVGSFPGGKVNANVNNADGWGTLRPDVALVLLGTNDVLEGRRIEDAARSLETTLRDVITELRRGNPNVEILLGTLTPMASHFPNADKIPRVNDMIRNLVRAEGSWSGSTASSPIRVVDHYAGQSGPAFSLRVHTDDGIHPNAAGDRLLAANWMSLLRPIIAKRIRPVPSLPPFRPPTPPAQNASQRISVEALQKGVAESDTSTARFVVSREGDTSRDLVVHYDVTGTASVGGDYVKPSGKITIRAGTSDEMIEIDIKDDTRREGNETLGVRLRANSSYAITSSSAALTIFDREGSTPWPTVSISRNTSTVSESNSSTAQFVVIRHGDISEDLVVHYMMTGSAAGGLDYVTPSGKVTIRAGTRDELIEVDIRGDSRNEQNEVIGVRLLSGANYTLESPFNAGIVIVDND